MHGYWSLVIFTLLGQAAAGMLILSFFSRTADTSRAKAWAACILLGVGALASLEHLSDPTVSFYTITNVGTSWLSREILFVGLFGAGLLLWLITLNAWARRLAAILGLAFVYVMSRVYTIPTVPFWNSLFTYWLFLATSLLLGSSLLLFMDALATRKDPEKKAALLLGWYPVFHRIGLHTPNAGDPFAAVVGAIAVLHLSAGMAFDAPALRRSAGPSAAHP